MWSFNTQWGSDILMWIYEKLRTVSLHCYLSFIHCSLYTFILFKPTMPWSGDSCCWLTQNPKDPGHRAEETEKEAETWTGMDLRKPTGELLSVCLLEGCLYQGDSSQRAWLTVRGVMEVHLRWWFYWWHQVTHRPLWGCYAGCLAWLAGEREREKERQRERDREWKQRAKGVGRVREYTGTQREATVSLQEQHADTCI